MTDKIAEFRRINEPRVQRAVAQLRHIEKSAKSMRMHELDITTLLDPVAEVLAELRDEDAVEILAQETALPSLAEPNGDLTPEGEQVAEVITAYGNTQSGRFDASAPVVREMDALSRLSTQQLVDRMIACGAELAQRRQ